MKGMKLSNKAGCRVAERALRVYIVTDVDTKVRMAHLRAGMK